MKSKRMIALSLCAMALTGMLFLATILSHGEGVSSVINNIANALSDPTTSALLGLGVLLFMVAHKLNKLTASYGPIHHDYKS